eukprot:Blabericola_migrator_1__854@NODE_120_length_13560_cov_140_919884_g26_i1_p4_GENE_NODE_120_length_13560_cov_140_919884_g26_i1NODE_120_length_13560_cov_140_919884_g26_i1_p4_ORF_typecomplete_len390_score73_27tRNA_bind/PF01588_20/1_3e20_NODE_120_length_13560_cov_140_919884_g26_i11184913018
MEISLEEGASSTLPLLCLAHGSGAVYKKVLTCKVVPSGSQTGLPSLNANGSAAQDIKTIIETVASKADPMLVEETPEAKELLELCISSNFDLASNPQNILKLNEYLLTRTYVGHVAHVTATDYLILGSIHKYMTDATPAQLQSLVPLVRYHDHMQHLPGLTDVIEPVDVIAKFNEGKAKGDVAQKGHGHKKGKGPDGKKEENKSTAQQQTAKATATDTRPLDDVSRLEMKCGVVVSITENPEGESLYSEEVDCGEPELRKIGSGLRKHIKKEDLQGARVVVLANMKVKNLRGWPSHGMLMCASNADHSKIELMSPPECAKPGDIVRFEGYDSPPDEVLSTKKNQEPLPHILKHLVTDENCVGRFKGARMIHVASGQEVRCATIKQGSIS